MSFKCGLCGNTSQPHEKAVRVITETREKIYPPRVAVNTFTDKLGTQRIKDDPGGVGREIVTEVLACPRCDEERLLDKIKVIYY